MNEGKLFAETASGLVEVVSVNSSELARLPYDLAEGVYVVGTGSTGAAAALGVCGEEAPRVPCRGAGGGGSSCCAFLQS